MYKSMIFSNFTKWYNHYHKLILEHFRTPVRPLMLIYG